MELNEFIGNFAAQFDETDLSEFTAETKFKELGEWSSLLAMVIIAMADSDYNVKLKADDIRGSETIQDLYEIVNARAERHD